MSKTIIVAGGTGELGRLIVESLQPLDARVRALVRATSDPDAVEALTRAGARTVVVDYDDHATLVDAFEGGSCVVSALNGLRAVIVGVQTQLLEAAEAAGVERFIPSDFSMDYRALEPGRNRNLDHRREFASILERSAVRGTSILNGAFGELLAGEAPFVIPQLRRVLAWEDAEQVLDFTTRADTAAFAAHAALDDEAPRWLCIAGTQVSARDIAVLASEVSGAHYRVLCAGDLRRLERLIRVARLFDLREEKTFPAWQAMQYMHDMYSGDGRLEALDNDRYPGLTWTSARELVAVRVGGRALDRRAQRADNGSQAHVGH